METQKIIISEDSKPKRLSKQPKPVTETVKVVDDTYTVSQCSEPMNVLFIIHGYADTMGSGAERMVQTMSHYLTDRGHNVTIAVKRPIGDSDGKVKIIRCKTKEFEASVKNYDVVFSHLDLTPYAQDLARDNKKPFFWICHNTHNYVIIRSRTKYANVIYNAEWVRRTMDYPNNNIVLPPPCDYRRWDDGLDHYSAKYITLVNHNLNKGGNVLIRLAKMMPDRQFMAVAGSYDTQVMDRTLPNVKYVKQTQDMKSVYKNSRIVIMPSAYESWGLVFNEAGASGIPVIMHPTDGLKENAGDSGIYCDRVEEEEWVEAIKKLDDKKYYKEVSDKVRARTRELDPYKYLEQFETFVHGLWKQYNQQ